MGKFKMQRSSFSFLFACLLALLAMTLTACGSDHNNTTSNSGSRGGRVVSRGFMRLVDGNYESIKSLILNEHEPLGATIAYGSIDENGKATIYPGKFEVRCNFGGEPTGYLTVDPANVNTNTCNVAVDLEKEEDSSYVYFVPNNAPGILSASLPVVVVYGDESDERGGKYQFLRQVDGQYEVIHSLIMDVTESPEATIAYGYLDDNNEAVLYPGKFTVRNVYGEEIVNSVVVTPNNETTESCKVTLNLNEEDLNSIDLSYIYVVPEDCPGVLSDSLPVVITDSGRGGKYQFLRLEDGQYKVIHSLVLNIDGTPVDIAYGYLDENGEAVLYSGKFSARCNFEEPNGFITVDPAGVNVESCKVAVDREKEKLSHYIFFETDNCPGVCCASLPIRVDYKEDEDKGMDRGGQYQFLRQVDGQYEVIHSLIMDVMESPEATIAYGYLDDNNEAVLYPGKFTVRNIYGEEIVNSLVVTPNNETTESCQVTLNLEDVDLSSIDLSYIYFVPEDCPGVLSDSLPVVITDSGRGSRYNFLRQVDGRYKVINSLVLNIDGTPANIAYGYLDENGKAVLYPGKFTVRCCFEEPNGFVTVDPSGVNVETCKVAVDREKEKISPYILVEPDNCPGVCCASLPVSIDYRSANVAK
ncbi:hypothetical protein IJT10_02445 [bacterium]|nr:hypothetical protein [bacterium]